MERQNRFLSNFIIATMVLFVLCTSFFLPQSVFPASVNKVPVYKGTKEDKVSLMVNVYWGTEYVEPMLDVFDSYEIETTFFLGGSWVEKNHDLARLIVSKGHELGNHGYFHKDHKKISKSANKAEIENCHKIVKAVCGIDMDLFAPPSGSFSADTLDIAEEIGYNTIMWSLDTIDWRDKDVSLIVKRATEKASGGDLILMHPTRETLEALPVIIDKLLSKGLTVSKVSEVL
jgi:peptidoglycan/xylan/chitin deacetylase (PgdA/CDA1 family)